MMTMINQLSAALLLFISIMFPSDAKEIGKDVFACSPTSFTFGLNLNGQCPGMIESRPGIDGTDCYFIEGLTSIPTPVSVTQIQILELNVDLLTIYAKTLNGEFEDGYSWEYTSITSGELTDETELPGGIQLNIRGVDSNGTVVTNSVIIDYSNTADAYPILKIGDEIGWIVIMDLAPARAEYCPVVTEAPVTSSPDTEAPITEAPMTSPPILSRSPAIDLETAFPTQLPMSMDYHHPSGKGRGKKGSKRKDELEGSKQKKSRTDKKKAMKEEEVSDGVEKDDKKKQNKKS